MKNLQSIAAKLIDLKCVVFIKTIQVIALYPFLFGTLIACNSSQKVDIADDSVKYNEIILNEFGKKFEILSVTNYHDSLIINTFDSLYIKRVRIIKELENLKNYILNILI